MPTTQVQPSAELASAGYCENAFGAESAYLVEHDSQSLNGLIALGERPARAMTGTTAGRSSPVSRVLPRCLSTASCGTFVTVLSRRSPKPHPCLG